MKRYNPSGLKIGLVYDLRNDYLAEGLTEEQVAEFDAEATIEALERAIRHLGHGAERIGHGRALCRRLVNGDRWDLVFTIAEGLNGRSREAQVPALLEMFGQGYTFSDPLVCAVTLDKGVAKRIVRSAGLATPAFHVVACAADLHGVDLHFPLFAKPIAEGTSKGVNHRSRIDAPAEFRPVCLELLERFAQPVLVEEYLPGREFTVGVLGTGPLARVLGTMEVRVKAGAPAADYSFEVKERCEEFVDYGLPEPGALRDEVEALGLAVYRLLDCRDAGRVDIRLDGAGRPAFLEVNPLPGLHPTHSDLPMIATMAGLTYEELIRAIVESAVSRRGAGAAATGRTP
jgi:D-alanine-D-alanine ligase